MVLPDKAAARPEPLGSYGRLLLEDWPAAAAEIQGALSRNSQQLRRHQEQLLGDLWALLTGLRPLVMLDYVATKPQQLLNTLAGLAAFSSFPGCILQLEGCCYLANAPSLIHSCQQRLSSLQQQMLHSKTAPPLWQCQDRSLNTQEQQQQQQQGAGSATASTQQQRQQLEEKQAQSCGGSHPSHSCSRALHHAPLLVRPEGAGFAVAAASELGELLLQLEALLHLLQARLGPALLPKQQQQRGGEQRMQLSGGPVWESGPAPRQQHAGARGQEGLRQPGCSPAGWPVVLLDDAAASFPCMPTLNGWLLGYPVVYWVRDYEEAVAASKALSCCGLLRYSFHVIDLPRFPAGSDGSSSGRASRGKSRSSGGGGGSVGGGSSSSSSSSAWLLMAFTVPEALQLEELQLLVEEMVHGMQEQLALAGGAAAGHQRCPRVSYGASSVGPQAVSL